MTTELRKSISIHYFIFFINPFFLVFGRDRSGERETPEDEPPPEYISFPFFRLRDSFSILDQKIKKDVINSPEEFGIYKTIVSKMVKETDQIIDDGLPRQLIIWMTFALSVAIASCRPLREKFYATFKGKVPAFTQYLLHCLRIGPLEARGDSHLAMIQFNHMADCLTTLDEHPSPLVDPNYLKENNCSEMWAVRYWFVLLEKYCSTKGIFFRSFVNLKPIPLYGNDLNSLPAFLKKTPVDENELRIAPKKSYASTMERYYITLAISLSGRLVNTENSSQIDDYEWYAGHKHPSIFLPGPSEQADEDKETAWILELLHFITHCSAEDLEIFNCS